MIVKHISTTKKKPITLYWDVGKMQEKVSQELARPYPSQAPGSKIVNSFERLSLENRELPGYPFQIGPPRKCFPGFSSPGMQRPL
jgi:hypothetical protein